ncbi:MAG: ribonuclease Z [Defluviitaleaceae bacterium]|nr:ribonuclease Z [Defluviitaleaceae bacterium]
MIDVALVGTGGMMPLPGRFLSSMLCRVNGKMILFDCGEGTQVSLRMLGWGFKQIDMICFTHFHGDHVSGLPGLLLTMANAERTEPLKLFGPKGLEYVVKSLCVIAQDLSFPLEFFEWEGENTYTMPADMLSIKTLPLNHRAPCLAYSVELARRGKFDLERAKSQNIPMAIWSQLQKQNEDPIVYSGVTYTSDMVLGEARKGLKLVFCTDTRPVKGLPAFARDADLFICEGLYGEADKQEKTAARRHMTFQEAAEMARAAGAKELWLTHFSPALPDPYNYLENATAIFANTKVGKDRMTTTLTFTD